MAEVSWQAAVGKANMAAVFCKIVHRLKTHGAVVVLVAEPVGVPEDILASYSHAPTPLALYQLILNKRRAFWPAKNLAPLKELLFGAKVYVAVVLNALVVYCKEAVVVCTNLAHGGRCFKIGVNLRAVFAVRQTLFQKERP